MLPAIDGDDCPGDVACTVADQERGGSADVVDIDQMVLGRRGRRAASSSSSKRSIPLTARDRIGAAEIACARIPFGPSSAAV